MLARAGVLGGYRSTIHWELMADFKEEFPRLEISPDLFVIDRDRFTCGGGTAGLDMMLALIGRQHGQPLAVAVAEQFLHTRIRQPTESQRMNILARYHITDGRVATAIAVMEQHVEQPLPNEAVALRCGVSPRQLERLFLAALDNTPGQFYLELRLRLARRLLTETSQSILQIALSCGFARVPLISGNATARRSRTRPPAPARASSVTGRLMTSRESRDGFTTNLVALMEGTSSREALGISAGSKSSPLQVIARGGRWAHSASSTKISG